MSKKEEILNEMLNKGYINQEKYQEKLLDENFSDYDAATLKHIEEAYADAENGNYTRDDFKRKYAKWLAM